MTKPTGSQMQLTAACNGSLLLQRDERALPNVSGPPAKLGSAIHQMIADPDKGEAATKLIADAHGIELTAEVRGKLESLEEQIQQIISCAGHIVWIYHEVATNYGTLDVLIHIRDADGNHHAIIIDLKTGWSDVAEAKLNLQLASYAAGADEEFSRPSSQKHDTVRVIRDDPVQRYKTITVYILRPFHKVPEPAVYRRGDMETTKRVIDTLRDRAVSDRANLCPGDHCSICRARNFCPALSRAVSPLCSDIVGGIELDTASMDGPTLGSNRDLVKAAKKELGRVLEAFDDEVITRGGIDIGDGERLVPKSITTRKLDVPLAWTIAADVAGERLPDCVSISLPQLQNAAADGVGREKVRLNRLLGLTTDSDKKEVKMIRDALRALPTKKAARDQVYTRLNDADAIIKSESIRITKEKIQDHE